MSYIHSYNDNYYAPNDSLQNLFQVQIVQPFEETLPIIASQFSRLRELRDAGLNDQSIIERLKYLSVDILKQGRTNFNKPSGGFPQ